MLQRACRNGHEVRERTGWWRCEPDVDVLRSVVPRGAPGACEKHRPRPFRCLYA